MEISFHASHEMMRDGDAASPSPLMKPPIFAILLKTFLRYAFNGFWCSTFYDDVTEVSSVIGIDENTSKFQDWIMPTDNF